MQKREFLALAAVTWGWGWSGASAGTLGAEPAAVTVACAGAHVSATEVTGYWVGLMQPHWESARMQRIAYAEVPSRAHGVAALTDGGFVAVANRPGRWLARLDAKAQVQCMLNTTDAVRTFEGHLTVSPDGQWVYTTETDPRTGQGWVAVRDVRTLQAVAEFRTGGSEPHQLLLDGAGMLVAVSYTHLTLPTKRIV